MERKARDQEVWEAFLRDEEGAFESLYLTFVDRLFYYGCRITSDQALVEDAIQDTFLKLYRRQGAFRQVENIRSYLFVTLRNYLHSHRRRSLRRERRQAVFADMQAANQPTASHSGTLHQLREDLKEELAKLPPRQQEILFLKFFEGFDYDEIGEVMGISYQVARNYLYRGLRQLREEMAPKRHLFTRWIASFLLLFSFLLP